MILKETSMQIKYLKEQGVPPSQIARQLGKRPGTVRVWLHRAYKILRRDLAPLLEEVRS